MDPYLVHYTAIIAVLGGALLLVLWMHPKISGPVQGAFVFLVPLGFHVYFLAAGLISGVILNPPFLLVVSMTTVLVALRLHWEALKRWLTGVFSGQGVQPYSERQW